MGGGRVAAPTKMERAIALIDEQLERILGAHFDALEAERTLFGSNGDELSAADHAMRVKAAEYLLNRAYGTPKQSVDVAHSGGLTIEALFVGDPLAETHSELPEEGE